ncbi:ABC transporter permease [Aminobacter sp. NyZ550]|jgi:peptide/nickel transport system permease protein|uniref:Peptide/nickel transport system permease protein n=1 Tax=Aminobacter ciceronei TaxID=150723 RepID=A0ABR6C058_9HYPH|nr:MULTISPECIES: ABC transporter permease [Aminobacter]WMC95310.1 ABC transporter permease [Aminobacter aminovorans]MBA8904324.1 peptide/nickel transport system permease protein [Aminobacter ciceronei]MBA9018102.1 peptide/nickel transport system permease protein [Aminobacter ciceronei]MRX35544.1 ABC transporter permease subunit [Aminobacter sp. MDW-2]QNH36925.1 ABC transporter permease [Aminobacter sp. MDW-2]
MIGFTLRRLVLLLPVFFVVSLVVFFIIHLVPGDPIDNLMRAGSTPEQRLQIAAKYGLDRSLVEQYVTWMGRLLTGDLGTSIIQGRPVSALIARNLPYSLELGIAALLFSTLTGIAAGVIAASYQGTRVDDSITGFILLGSTVPSFWLGLLLILVFAVWLGWVPVSGARGWSSLILPTIAAGLGGIALVARVTRIAMIETSRQDFVTLLHAKGLPPFIIQLRHVLRHAMVPVVTILSLRIGWVLGGAVTIEYVFARPGLGSLLIRALNQRDYPLVQGCLLMLAMAVIIGALIGDIVQAAMDPRQREARA